MVIKSSIRFTAKIFENDARYLVIISVSDPCCQTPLIDSTSLSCVLWQHLLYVGLFEGKCIINWKEGYFKPDIKFPTNWYRYRWMWLSPYWSQDVDNTDTRRNIGGLTCAALGYSSPTTEWPRLRCFCVSSDPRVILSLFVGMESRTQLAGTNILLTFQMMRFFFVSLDI